MSEPLSDKLRRRLSWIALRTDNPGPMYPGDYWDAAARQHAQLERLGFVALFQPHNPVHKNRVVITEAGRAMLSPPPPSGEGGK